MRGGAGVEKALVQQFDENDCVVGWAIQITTDVPTYALGGASGGGAQMKVTGVQDTAVVLLPAGTVTEFVRVDGLISNGTTRTFLAFSLQFGGTTTQNIATGGDTWQYRLNVDGSVDVRRTAGTGTATVSSRFLYI